MVPPAKRRRTDFPNLPSDIPRLDTPCGPQYEHEASKASIDLSNESVSEAEDEETESDHDSVDSETHSQSKEPMPHYAAYDSKIQIIQEESQGMVEMILKASRAFDHVSSEIRNMTKRVEDIMVCPEPKLSLIMLYGTTGAGKTSTLLSIIDVHDLVKVGATGDSCTCVPTMLLSKLPGQTEQFAARITFFNLQKCEDFLREQCQIYYRFNFQFEETWTQEERQEFQALAETSLKIFQSLFCDQAQFSELSKIESFFEGRYGANVETTVKLLTGWASRLIADTIGGPEPSLFFQANSGKRLHKQIQTLIYEHESTIKPVLWALVECVEIGVEHSRILKHVRLLDLPGFGDMNTIRATIANEYIKRCDAMWVVANMSRSISDIAVDRIIATYGERFRGNIAIITTGSDVGIDDALARAMEEKGHDIEEYWKYQKELKTLTKNIKRLEARMYGGSKCHELARSSTDHSGELWRKRERLIHQRQATQNAQFELLVKARNVHVSKNLQQGKQKHLPDRIQIPVFCISNTQYEAWKGTLERGPRQMSISLTGITALRKHALGLAAPTRFQNFQDYIERVIIVVKGYQVWANGPVVARHDQLLGTIDEPQIFVRTLFQTLIKRSMTDITHNFVGSLLRVQPYSIVEAEHICSELSAWHHSTVRAFFNRHGRHQTASRPWQVWNDRFTRIQTENVINMLWGDIIKQQQVAFSGALHAVHEKLEELIQRLQSEPSSVPLPVGRFAEIIKGCMQRISYAGEIHFIALRKELGNIKLEATHDIPSGYFTSAMRHTYVECMVMRGQGCTKSMLYTLRKKVTAKGEESPFDTFAAKLEENLETLVEAVAAGLQSDVDQILQEMSEQLTPILRDSLETRGEALARSQIKESLGPAQQGLDRILDGMSELKFRYGLHW